MKATLTDLSIGLDGKQRLTITTGEDLRGLWDRLRDGEVRVEIKKWHDQRSLTANNYAWVLIDKLAEALNLPKVEIYRNTILSIGGVSTFVCILEAAAERMTRDWEAQGIGWMVERYKSRLAGCVNLKLYYGSSVYDTKQMSQLIDRLVDECKELDIETMPPAELAALKDSWKGH